MEIHLDTLKVRQYIAHAIRHVRAAGQLQSEIGNALWSIGTQA
jgi:hypothetical protein